MAGVFGAVAWPFRFRGGVGRAPYLVGSLVALYGAQAAAAAGLAARGEPIPEAALFWITPERALTVLGRLALPPGAYAYNFLFQLPGGALLAALAAWMLLTWSLAALAFRRATTLNRDPWIAFVAAMPLLQVPAVLLLALESKRREGPEGEVATAAQATKWLRARAVLLGLFIGIGLSAAAVAVGALVFGAYGYTLFVATPLLIGALSAWIANREQDIGSQATWVMALTANLVGGLALVGFALEGVVCLVMAAPIAFVAASIGAALGRWIALQGRGKARSAFTTVAFLPVLFATERAAPATIEFADRQSVDISAPPSAVWSAATQMAQIHDRPALPFRLGLAYPLRGEIIGRGVGALRRGYFSTGVATERVTEWAPGRRLAFVILTEPPSLRELSPYRTVHAPHVRGYFRTRDAAFELIPLPGGRTRLVLTSRHELDLEPAVYWTPFARWAVRANKLRALAQIRRQAEAAGQGEREGGQDRSHGVSD